MRYKTRYRVIGGKINLLLSSDEKEKPRFFQFTKGQEFDAFQYEVPDSFMDLVQVLGPVPVPSPEVIEEEERIPVKEKEKEEEEEVPFSRSKSSKRKT